MNHFITLIKGNRQMSRLDLTLDAELLAARKAIEKRDNEIIQRTAIAALNGAGGAVEMLTPILVQDAKVVETHRGVDVRFRVGSGWGDVNEAVELLKTDPQTSKAFTQRKKNPEFALPVRNPWKPESRNLTDQMVLLRKNPELAARLKAEAGV
jgi:hypothetical protein